MYFKEVNSHILGNIFMNNHPIEGLMQSTMENFKDMIDVNTIIGEAIETSDGTVILPISKVSFGFASGGSEFNQKKEFEKTDKLPFGGASGAGVSLKPVAFLVIKGDSVRLLSVDHENTCDRIIDSVPQIIDLLKGTNKNKKEENSNVKAETSDTTSDTI
jgi:sporulation protein YtfJ